MTTAIHLSNMKVKTLRALTIFIMIRNGAFCTVNCLVNTAFLSQFEEKFNYKYNYKGDHV